MLMVCYAISAGVCLAMAVAPRLWWLMAPMIAAVAGFDGVASGALLALIGKAARADSVGAVMGTISATAAFGALLPALLLLSVDRLSHSYMAACLLLAAAMLAAALYVRSHGLYIGLGLPVRYEPEPSATATTITVVGGADTRLGAAAVVARLAELAASDELVVVYGCDEPPHPEARKNPEARKSPEARKNTLVAGLRVRLPRYTVVAVDVPSRPMVPERFVAQVSELVEAGTVPVAVTPSSAVHTLTAELSSYLGADRVLLMSYSLATGARVDEVWSRAR
jgi:hypothetical protein